MELRSTARAVCLAGCLLFGLACRAQADGGTIYDIHVLGGAKLTQGWPDVSRGDGEVGLEFDVQPASWPVAPYVSISTGTDLFSTSNTEYQFGARKYWATGDLGRAFAGGGLALAKGSEDGLFSSASSQRLKSDLAAGPWIGGGYIFTFGRHFDLGLNLDYSYARGALKNSDGDTVANVNLGGFHIDGVIGAHF